MKKALLILSFMILFSCKKEKMLTEEQLGNVIVERDVNKIDSDTIRLKNNRQPFFDFDKIMYYHLDITIEEIIRLSEEYQKSGGNTEILGMLSSDVTNESLTDAIFLNDIKKLYPVNREINKKDFGKVKEIFSDRYNGNYSVTTCMPYYIDILIFTNDNKVSGIAKICFECGKFSIAGTDRNTERFGQNGDYGKLMYTLEPYLPLGSKLHL